MALAAVVGWSRKVWRKHVFYMLLSLLACRTTIEIPHSRRGTVKQPREPTWSGEAQYVAEPASRGQGLGDIALKQAPCTFPRRSPWAVPFDHVNPSGHARDSWPALAPMRARKKPHKTYIPSEPTLSHPSNTYRASPTHHACTTRRLQTLVEPSIQPICSQLTTVHQSQRQCAAQPRIGGDAKACMSSTLAPLAPSSTFEQEVEHPVYPTAFRDTQVALRQRALASACDETRKRLGLEALAGPTKAIAWTALLLALASWIETDADLQQDGRRLIDACRQLGLLRGVLMLSIYHILLLARVILRRYTGCTGVAQGKGHPWCARWVVTILGGMLRLTPRLSNLLKTCVMMAVRALAWMGTDLRHGLYSLDGTGSYTGTLLNTASGVLVIAQRLCS